MKISRMKAGQWGKLRAFFDLEVDGFTIKGFKIVEGSNGLFVSMPSQKNEDGEYNDTVWVEKDVRPKLNEVALSHYTNEQHPTPTRRSGGMSEVAYEQENGKDGEIPF